MGEMSFEVAKILVMADKMKVLSANLRSIKLKSPIANSEGKAAETVLEIMQNLSGLGNELCLVIDRTSVLLTDAANRLQETDSNIGARY